MLKHNTVCRRNTTASGVLLDVVNQSTRSLFSKNRKVSRLTFKCNFRNPSKRSRIFPASVFTKLVTAQQNSVHVSHKVFQPNRKKSVETADRNPFIPLHKIWPTYTTLMNTQYNILDASRNIFFNMMRQTRAKNSFMLSSKMRFFAAFTAAIFIKNLLDGTDQRPPILISFYFLILHYDQQMHNYVTNYHTPTCFDNVMSSSGSL